MQLPFFSPLHPAVRVHCNLCGTHIQTDTFLTEKVRNVRTLEQQGDYVFCASCGERAAEYIKKINEFEAHLSAKMADEIKKSKLEYAASLLPTAFPKAAPEPAKADLPGKGVGRSSTTKRKPLPGEIPQPVSLNG